MKLFGDCFPIDPERWTKAFQAWSEANKIYKGKHLPIPDETTRIEPIINAPGYEEEEEMKLDKEVRQTPRHQARVK